MTELIKIIKPIKSIIISSIKNKKEIPTYLRLIGKIKLHKIFPAKYLNKSNFILFWLFGIKNEQEKILLVQILHDTEVKFIKWALNTILNWKQEPNNFEIFHIHGTNDRMLPIRFVKPNCKIDGGGHFMAYSMADKINSIITKELGCL